MNFSQSAWYEPSEGWNVEKDWNKLCGWSIGWLPWKVPGKPWYKPSSWEPAHHKNSVRVGWRASGTKEDPRIELCLYTYHNGVRTTTELGNGYQLGEDLDVRLFTNSPGKIELEVFYKGTLDHDFQYVYQLDTLPKGLSYSLKPYFGGSFPAPHTMTIEVTQQP